MADQRPETDDELKGLIGDCMLRSSAGFRDGALRTCCGAPGTGQYNFNMQAKCDQNGSSVCPDPTTHVSWDGIHMTETAHRIIAAGWLHGPYLDPPF